MTETETDLHQLKYRYKRDGYVSPIDIISAEDAARHRQAMEAAETAFGDLHYTTKVHTILRSPFALVSTEP